MSEVAVIEAPQPLEILSAVRRRMWLVILIVLGLSAAAVAAAMLWPPTYRSSGTILIEAPDIPNDLVRTTVSTFADQRLKVIEQRVMTTQNLIGIVNKFDLYPEERRRTPMNAIVGQMRRKIKLELVSADVTDPQSGRTRKATIAFTVSFDHDEAGRAQAVANELVTLYLSENLRSRQEQAAGTAEFLSEESRKLQGEIREMEGKLAAFKTENTRRLPEQLGMNTQLLDRTQGQLLEVMRQMLTLRERQAYLSAQLAQTDAQRLIAADGQQILSPQDQLRALEMRYVTLTAKFGANHPEVVSVRRQIEALSGRPVAGPSIQALTQRRAQLSAELAEAQKRFGDNHPDVLRLTRELAQVETQMSTATRDPRPLGGAPRFDDIAPTNPIYIQLQTQLAGVSAELNALQVQEQELRARAVELEERVIKTPEVERDYADMRRQYELLTGRYEQLRARESQADLAQSLEAGQRGERFSVIEPPVTPTSPIWPNRPAIILLGMVLAVAVGVGSTFGIDMLTGKLYGPRRLAALTGATPLAVIPYVRTSDEVARERTRWITLAALVIAAGIAGLAYVHLYVQPLENLYWILMARLGF